MFKKVLIATDGSERSEKAAKYAFAMAKACDAELQVVSIVNAGSPREAFDIDPDFHEETEEMTDVNVDELKEQRSAPEQKVVENMMASARENGLKVSSHIAMGDPSKEILSFAGESGTDVIVIGSHGRSALASAVMGSVCTKIVHAGEIPVLVVPVHED